MVNLQGVKPLSLNLEQIKTYKLIRQCKKSLIRFRYFLTFLKITSERIENDITIENIQEKWNQKLLYHFLEITFLSFPGDKNGCRFLTIN